LLFVGDTLDDWDTVVVEKEVKEYCEKPFTVVVEAVLVWLTEKLFVAVVSVVVAAITDVTL